MPSTVSDAITEIDEFESRDNLTPWSLSRLIVASRLRDLVNAPALIQQGNLNLCGPAATFLLWCKRDPLAFAKYCIQLFEQGVSVIGSISINPDSDLLNQDYNAVNLRMTVECPQADWMAMSALRDSANAVLDFEGTPEEDVSGITTPSEIAEWLDATGCYQSVKNEGEFLTNPGIEHAKTLRPDLNQDIVMLINANMLPGSEIPPFDIIASRFPNHYIVLDSPIEFIDGLASFSYWTWGKPQPRLEIDQSTFDQNYFGAIIANF